MYPQIIQTCSQKNNVGFSEALCGPYGGSAEGSSYA